MPERISGSVKLQQLLSRLNQDSGFPISVLTDSQGLAIASDVSEGMDADRQSAVVAFVQKMAAQATRQLGMGITNEISLYDEKGQHLVCRPFQVNGHEFILAVLVPEKGLSYRRATTQVISEIRRTWKDFWE